MYQRHIIGKYGEDVAERYLMQKGYNIIERNFMCKQGEIDIIAEHSKYIVFIEVKTRSNYKYGTPAMATNNIKKQHIKSAANIFLYINKFDKFEIRFDVIEVFINNGKCYINHIKNAM